MTKHPVPDNFNDIIVDLISDLDTTFPEYRTLLTFYKQDSFKEKHLQSVFDYCVTFFPNVSSIFFTRMMKYSQTIQIHTFYLTWISASSLLVKMFRTKQSKLYGSIYNCFCSMSLKM